MRFKGESCSGGKFSKERITVLLCTNMDGSEKKKIDIIGKSAKPRCFGKSSNNLPVNYYSNKNAWMDSELWLKVMKKFNEKLQKENRNILMFIDNCSAHPNTLKLSNIKFVFLPPNTTSCIQPLDGGIIKAFKGYYRKLMVKQLLAIVNSGKTIEPNSITLLIAIHMIRDAWNEIKVSTIENCFKKCGFDKNGVEDECEVDHEFIEYWDTASRILDINIDFNEFVECDDEVAVCETITNDNIVDGIIEKRNDGEQSVGYETEANDEEIVCEIVTEVDPKPPSLLDVTQALSTLRNFFSNCNVEDESVFNDLSTLSNKAFKYNLNSIKQTKITDYFKT